MKRILGLIPVEIIIVTGSLCFFHFYNLGSWEKEEKGGVHYASGFFGVIFREITIWSL